MKKDISTSRELCNVLLVDTGVAILPGSAFGRPDRELTARLAFVDFDGGKALAGYPEDGKLDSGYLKENCSTTLEAIDRLCAWLATL